MANPTSKNLHEFGIKNIDCIKTIDDESDDPLLDEGSGIQICAESEFVLLSSWDNLLVSYDMNGDDTQALLDSGPTNNHCGAAYGMPIKTVGLIDDARQTTNATMRYLATDGSAFLTTPTWAIIIWAKPIATNGGLFELRYPGSERITAGYLSSRWFVTSTAGSFGTLQPIIPNQYQMVACVYDGSDFRFSVNAGTPIIHTKSIAGPSISLQIFRTEAGSLAGNIDIDCFRYFDGDFGQSFILEQYNGGAGLTYLESII